MIEVNHLKFRYDEDTPNILNDISFSIPAGQWVALIGHNGSGKSTLVKALDGLIKVNSGTIKVNGIILEEKTVWDVRKQIGIVFQNPDNQFVGANVENDVAFGLENIGVSRDDMILRIDNALSEVKMTAYRKHDPSRLSGGQKQRVAIAGVLALAPKIVIFDEATSMLDPEGRQDILNLMRKLHDEKKMTIISITHDIDEASNADRVIVLDDGKIINEGTPREIFSNGQALENIGLDVPYQEKLKRLLKEKGFPIKDEYQSKEELEEQLCRLLSNK